MTNKPVITQVPSPNFGYPTSTAGRQGRAVIALVYHIMEGTLAGTDSWFAARKSGASTHFGVGAKGEIHQYVALGDAAWGNGLMKSPDLSIPWLKECWDGNLNPNLVTVSIEHEGAHVRDAAGNITTYWAPTEAQYQASLALTRWLMEFLKIPTDIDYLIGHSRIDGVTRVDCPGRGFPWRRLFTDLALAPAWNPAAEIQKLKARGVINSDHAPEEPLAWGTFATVLNRILDRKG